MAIRTMVAGGRLCRGMVAGTLAMGLVTAGIPVAGTRTAEAAPVALHTAYQAPAGTAPGQRVIALTFDDGPSPVWTPQVLAILEQFHIAATFFEIGKNVAAYPATTAAVAAAGFPVEDHTYTHPDLTTLSAAQVDSQIDLTQRVIGSVTGVTPSCLRPPYNSWDTAVLDDIDQRGLATMGYSIDPRDWSLPGVAAIVNRVVGAAFPGAVVDLHDAGGNRAETVAALPAIITGLESRGYRFVDICGTSPAPPPPPPPPVYQSQVYNFGSAAASAASPVLSSSPLVGSALAVGGHGYWVVSASGQVFAEGGATDYGDLSGSSLAEPIVGMAATADGGGYWLVAADGGVFAFGDAPFYGSLGATVLHSPVVGLALDPATNGYWLVAADGGVFAFHAPFLGSMGAVGLNQPVVGMSASGDGQGYRLVAADGGIFSFGDAGFHGSMGGVPLDRPVVGMAEDVITGGYWLLAGDGGVFNFDAPFVGAQGGSGASRYVSLVPTDGDGGYFLVAQVPVELAPAG